MFTPLTCGSRTGKRKVCVCVAVRRPLRVLRREKRETCTFEFVLVWVYFERKSFESGFRDLTLRCKVLRGSGACVLPPQLVPERI